MNAPYLLLAFKKGLRSVIDEDNRKPRPGVGISENFGKCNSFWSFYFWSFCQCLFCAVGIRRRGWVGRKCTRMTGDSQEGKDGRETDSAPDKPKLDPVC